MNGFMEWMYYMVQHLIDYLNIFREYDIREELITYDIVKHINYHYHQEFNPVYFDIGLLAFLLLVASKIFTLLCRALYGGLFPLSNLNKRIILKFRQLIMLTLSSVNKKDRKNRKKAIISIKDQFVLPEKVQVNRKLPKFGVDKGQLINLVDALVQMDNKCFNEGVVSGAVYVVSSELDEIYSQVYKNFIWSNPLHPDIFKATRKMEVEVVRMVLDLFNGDENSCGSVTTGGTESIMLACKAYRDMAYERGITEPEMIIPITAHAAFEKAANFLRIKIHFAEVDKRTYKCTAESIKPYINSNTCMIAVSAPNFPHGIIDHIVDISKLALYYKINLHIDCCLGGFLLPFMAKVGYPVEAFDFTLPGVSSISADTHKYAFTPRGSSVLMFRNTELRRYQFSCSTDWPGGIHISPCLSGSRVGSNIATCWAGLMYHGYKGYLESTRKIIGTTRYIRKELQHIHGIQVIGEPLVSIVAFTSKNFDIFSLLQKMTHKKWNLTPLQYPSAIHMCVTLIHTRPGVAEAFIEDIKSTVEFLIENPTEKPTGSAALYETCQSIDDKTLVDKLARTFLDSYYDI